jgi:Ca2+-binding RTX toxin-like protein
MLSKILLLSGLAVAGLLALGVGVSLAASNTVPASRAKLVIIAITADTLKPSQCSGITLTAKLTGSGNITGTSASELITGGSAAQTITGGGGNDCILGGGGNDAIDCGTGTDVAIGGAGTDTNTNSNCETFIQ